jgi:phosphate transport system protein
VVRHFEAELNELRTALLEMSGLVEAAIYRSVLSLVRRDESQAQEVFQNEARINRMQIEIDDRANRLLALEQPVAKDLRLITAAIKINNDLERMGDEAVNIAERSQSLVHETPIDAPIDISSMASQVESQVRKALDSFVKQQPDVARSVLESDDAIDEAKEDIYRELLKFMEKDPRAIAQCVSLMFVAHSLERIADHATNIAEDVLFLVRGIDVRHHAEAGSEPLA